MGNERLNQMQDPEKSIKQAMVDYKRLGYSESSNPQTMEEHKTVAKRGGNIAKDAYPAKHFLAKREF